MDVFGVHERLIKDYDAFTTSLVHVRDPQVAEHVRAEREGKTRWPDPWLSLDPAFKPGGTTADLVAEGLLHPMCNDRTTAAHLLLCGGLAKASDLRREELRGVRGQKPRQWEFFDQPGSTWLLVAALAAALPVILPECPDDRLRVHFTGQGLALAGEIWLPFVEAVGPRLDRCLTPLLRDPRGLRRSDAVRDTLSRFRDEVTPDLEDRLEANARFRHTVRVVRS
ncbi:hypothetical protein [Micromonospora chersina]|uniref:hypothetical protein n=1 Tax=Micromonospora chersina TaxID=47854 RepID=UPI00371BABE8